MRIMHPNALITRTEKNDKTVTQTQFYLLGRVPTPVLTCTVSLAHSAGINTQTHCVLATRLLHSIFGNCLRSIVPIVPLINRS